MSNFIEKPGMFGNHLFAHSISDELVQKVINDQGSKINSHLERLKSAGAPILTPAEVRKNLTEAQDAHNLLHAKLSDLQATIDVTQGSNVFLKKGQELTTAQDRIRKEMIDQRATLHRSNQALPPSLRGSETEHAQPLAKK